MNIVQLQPNVGSETDLAALDGYGVGFEPPLSPRSTTSTTRRMHKRATDDGSVPRSQSSLNRHTSNSSHTQLPSLTLNMPKHMQLQHQHSLPTRKPSTDSFICGINECDPRCWIVAAGLLEKVRIVANMDISMVMVGLMGKGVVVEERWEAAGRMGKAVFRAEERPAILLPDCA